MGKVMKPVKTVKIGNNIKVKPGVEAKLKVKPGGSSVGKYKNVDKKSFAGPKGSAPEGSFPINTKKRGRAALSYANNAPNPEGIKKAVYSKYPALKKKKNKIK